MFTEPSSSTALTHGVDLIRGLPLHEAAREGVQRGFEVDRRMNDFGPSERDRSR